MARILYPGEAISIFKPICNRIMKEPSRSDLLDLKCLLGNVSPVVLQKIKDLILFPLEIHLQNEKLPSEVKRSLVDCTKVIFDNSQINDINRLFKLYSLLLFQIYDRQKPNLVGDVPEELKLSVIEAVTNLVKHISSDLVCEFYNRKYVPKIGQGIYICLQLARNEKLRSLRIAAIECVKALTYVHDDATTDDDVLRDQVGDVIMFFLPGIISALQIVATEDENQGHQVIIAAVEAWGQIIALVMEDRNKTIEAPIDFMSTFNRNQSDKEDPLRSSWDNHCKDALLKSLQEKSRTPEWYQAAAEKLCYSVKIIAKVQLNPNWKVRFKLSLVCDNLLSRCYRNLKPCVVVLVEILIALSEDENENVSEKSKSGLKLFSEICEMEQGTPYLEMLKDNFYALVTKLPRILHGTDEVQQLAALRLLAGYTRLMGKKLPELMKSTAHLNRLLYALIRVIELEVTVSVLEDYSCRDLEENYIYGNSVPWKQFKYFMDNDILKKLIDVCWTLGQYGDLHTLIWHLLAMFYNDPEQRKEVTMLVNEILIGGTGRSDVDLEAVVETVLETYVEPSTWYINVSLNTDIKTTLKEAHNNVVQVCLLAEGVGKMSKVVGSSFNRFLMKTLYLVLERVGSPNGLIAAAGMSAAQDMASACGFGNNVMDLVQANADYFSFHVSRRLHNIEENQGVLDVLQVVMKCCKLDMLPVLEEIIQDVLDQSHDTFQNKSTLSFMRVFYTFVSSVRHRLMDTKRENVGSDVESQCTLAENLKSSQVVDDLLVYHQCKRDSEKFSDDDDDENIKETEFNNENDNNYNCEIDTYGNKKKKISVHVNITVSILKRCVHFLPTKKKELKLLVLSVLKEGLLILEEWENELLPIVHAIWSPFVDRFNEVQDPIIINRSFDLLCVLAKTSKDFIQARTLKQVLPSLCKFLIKAAPESKKKDKGSSYRFTQIFKLQKELLSNLDVVVCHLNLQERQVNEVLKAASPYLSSLQPLPLQSACVELFKKLFAVNRDAVWLKLNSMWSHSKILKPSFPELKTIKFSEKSDHNQEEFKKNVEKILSFLNVDIC